MPTMLDHLDQNTLFMCKRSREIAPLRLSCRACGQLAPFPDDVARSSRGKSGIRNAEKSAVDYHGRGTTRDNLRSRCLRIVSLVPLSSHNSRRLRWQESCGQPPMRPWWNKPPRRQVERTSWKTLRFDKTIAAAFVLKPVLKTL